MMYWYLRTEVVYKCESSLVHRPIAEAECMAHETIGYIQISNFEVF